MSRHGAMVLAWTQDTVGPMCRSAEDCAIVFDAIYGPDGKDNTIIDVPFNWDATADVTRLRVGYLRAAFEGVIADNPDNPDAVGLEANRFRTRVMEEMDEAMADLDLFIGSQQALTNRTGHPVVSMPS